MADDPLKKWRRHLAPEQAPAAELEIVGGTQKDSGAYDAFKVLEKGVAEFISFHRAKGLVRRFSYRGLVEISDDGAFGTQIALVFNLGPVSPVVFISGENLCPLVLSLCFCRAESVYEFNPALWPEPVGKVPVVRKLEVVGRTSADVSKDVERRISAIESAKESA